MPGCWGHRDNILSDQGTFGNPTEMDAGIGTDSGGAVDYDAAFVVNPNPTVSANIIFTWAEEQALIGGSAPSISGVTLSGTPTAPTVTVTGLNLGAAPTAATTEPCGGTGNIYGASGLVFQDLTGSWGAGGAGDCIGLFVTSWSSTKVVFTFDSEYASFGPIKAGDQIEVTILGATDTVIASFTTATPTITNISPSVGPTSGGTTVTITGTNFTGVTAVTFGGAGPAKSFTFVSSTEITAVSPATGAAVARLIVVTTPSGTSANVPAADFTYEGAPTITNISPSVGPTSGGTTVTITGTNFTGVTAVTFGGAGPAKSFTFVSSTEITAVSPATGAAVARLIVVTTPSGTSANVPAADFTYKGRAPITNITPTRAQLQGELRSPLPGPTSPVSPRSPSVGPGQPRASRSSRAPRSPQYPRRPGLPWPV